MKSIIAVSLGLVACSPPVVDLSDHDGALVWASLDADGRVFDAGLYRGSGPSVAAPLAGTVLIWRIPKDGWIDQRGDPFDREGLDEIDLRREDLPRGESGACGRCLVPSDDYPQPLLPGDSCSIPAQATPIAYRVVGGETEVVSVEPEIAEAARSRLRVERSGACACVPKDRGPIGDVVIEDAAGLRFPLEVEAYTSDGQGGLFGFLPRRIVRFSKGELPVGFADPIDESSKPRFSVRLDNGDLLVQRVDPIRNRIGSFALYRYRQTGEAWAVTEVDIDSSFTPKVLARPLRDPFGRTFIGGKVVSETTIQTCNREGTACIPDSFASPVSEQDLFAIEARSDGAAFAATYQALFSKPTPTSSWRQASVTARTIAGSPGSIQIDGLVAIAAGEDRLVATVEARGGTWAIIAIPYDATGEPDLGLAELTYMEPDPDASIAAVYFDRSPDRFVALSWVDGSVTSMIDLDPLGQWVGSRPAAPTMPPYLERFSPIALGQYLAEDGGDGIFIGDFVAGFENIYGIDVPRPGHAVALLERRDGAAIALDSGRLILVENTVQFAVRDPEGLVEGLELRSGALLEHEVLVLATADGLVRVELSGLLVTSKETIAGSPPNLREVVKGDDGELWLIDDDATIFRFADGVASIVGTLERREDQLVGWRVSSVRTAGVWWIAGTDGVVTRCVGHRCTSLFVEAEPYVDLTTDCPDQVVVAVGNNTPNRGALLFSSALYTAGEAYPKRYASTVKDMVRTALWDGDDMLFLSSDFIYRGTTPTQVESLWGTPRRALRLDRYVVLAGYRGSAIVARAR